MLPDNRFNGRYYFIGEGAAAGFVPTTPPGVPPGFSPPPIPSRTVLLMRQIGSASDRGYAGA